MMKKDLHVYVYQNQSHPGQIFKQISVQMLYKSMQNTGKEIEAYAVSNTCQEILITALGFY